MSYSRKKSQPIFNRALNVLVKGVSSNFRFLGENETPIISRGKGARIWDADGKLDNAGFLDYRIPVASDLPMIDTEIVEVANPTHPFGVRGCGETPICAPLAATANAVRDATGVRVGELPISPPRLLAALSED